MAKNYSFVNNVLGHCRLCTRKDEAQDLVACDECDRWFHYGCVDLPCLPSAKEPWSCFKCRSEEREQEAQKARMMAMEKRLTELALEVEARAKAQKISEVHANSMEAELIHYKEELDSKSQLETKKQDVLLDIARAIQHTKIKDERNATLRMEEIDENDQEGGGSVALYMKRQEMRLPQFYGNAREWPAFKKIFEATTVDGRFSNLENLIRLQRALGGPAAKSVQALMLEEANIPKIIDQLEKQFGQAKRVYKEIREDLEKIRAGGHSTLVEVSNQLEGLVAHLTASKQSGYLNDPRLIEDLLGKLSYDIQIKWMEAVESNAKKGNPVATLQDLANWLKPKADLHRELVNSSGPRSSHNPTRHQVDKRVNIHQENQIRCFMCTGAHKLVDCKNFLKLKPSLRNQEAKRLRLCTMCLSKHANDCWYPVKCNQNNCNGQHHSLLHLPRQECRQESETPWPNRRQITATEEPVAEREETSNLHQGQRAKVFYQIIPVTLRNGHRVVKTYALLDPGSSLTLIEEEIAEALQLKGNIDPLRIKWTKNVTREEKTSRRVNVQVMGNSNEEFTLTGVRTAVNMDLPTQTVDYNKLKREYPFLANLPIRSYDNIRPKLMIGLDHSDLICPEERRGPDQNTPIAVRTKLGWLIFGKISGSAREDHFLMIQEDKKTHELLQKYFTTEDFGVKVPENLPESKQETRAKEIIDKTLNYTGERYEIGLLWKEDDPKLPYSYRQAYNRLLNLEGKLKKDPELKEWAINTVKDYVDKGYARKLTPEEVKEWAKDAYYLPHFIVINKNKSPPKPRWVFDAAAKSHGMSLNSALLTGPDATTSSFGVTTKFREGPIGSAGDIKEMFSQVKMRTPDQRKQCFLFRDCDESKEPEVYVMQVMIFGSTCSPACAQVVKNHNASLFAESKPRAAEAIVKQHYVDDYIDSFETPAEAIETIKDVMEIHNRAGFFIRNFVSNNKEVLAALPKDRVQETKIRLLEDKDSPNEKVLGVFWNTELDCIQFQLKFDRLHRDVQNGSRRPTMREVLSFVMSIYDPMGLISNLTIHGKILMQELHKETSSWDAEIPNHLFTQWEQWLEMIKQVSYLKIPRWILATHVTQFELHTFVDASEYAFAAVIYVRGMDAFGQTKSVRLMAAKTRVAPIRKLSIPRLELQAALLGARLTNTVQQELRKQPTRTVFWSDSQTVLSWIHSDHRKYAVFVAHRVGEILETSQMEQWRYVRTEENPADEGTKQVKGKSIWIRGPVFLWKDESLWTISKFTRNTAEEMKDAILHHHEVQYPNFNFVQDHRYSSWDKLVKRICILQKYVDWKSPGKDFDRNISEEDKERAERVIIKKAQWEGFSYEMEILTKHGELTKPSRISALLPQLNEHGIMVSISRLTNTTIVPLETRHPVILPYKHHITRLIMMMYHEKYYHHADNVVMGAVNSRYYVERSRQVLLQIKASCQCCKNQKASPVVPPMAPVPECRLSIYAPPFTHTGVDYFGPLEVQVKRSTEKRWGAIFTCLTTRAVHLELAERLDTDSFIVCLRNFQSRRGKVRHLYSDNGTNFVGAEREMQAAVKEIGEKMGRSAAAAMDIQWTFNPPAAPHFGGAWERLIQNVKKCLYQLPMARQHHKPSVEELRSALIQAEFILNARPLTHISLDSADDEPLTPCHFLTGRGPEYSPPLSLEAGSASRDHYKRIQHYAKYFWERWTKEYIPTLIKRDKWHKRVDPLKIDDIVVITDKLTPYGRWLKGRVINIHTAKDGQVRSAEVQTIRGAFIRPAAKIAVLDVRKKDVTEAKTHDHTDKDVQLKSIEAPNTQRAAVRPTDKTTVPGIRKRDVAELEPTTHCLNHHSEDDYKPVIPPKKWISRVKEQRTATTSEQKGAISTIDKPGPKALVKEPSASTRTNSKSTTAKVKKPRRKITKTATQPAETHRVNHHREVEGNIAGGESLRRRIARQPIEIRHIRPHYEELIGRAQAAGTRAAEIPQTSNAHQAEINFNSWGKRRKIDIDKVKELRDKMNAKQYKKRKVNPFRINAPWYIAILTALYLFATAFGQPTAGIQTFGNHQSGLIAYDCANPDVNMTSYSLLDVTSCLPSTKNLSISEVPIQVLQRNSKGSAMVYQCKMIIKRSIRHCGMHSHTSDYERGYSYIVKEFTPDECRRTQQTGAIPLTLSAGLLELKRNQTTRGETLVVGSVWSSSCSGGVYKTPEYTWINALVYFEYEIALYNYMATVDNENDQIMLRHGLVCPYSHGKCLDSEDGYSTWDVSLNQRCEETDFEVIYEGTVNKTINLDKNKRNQHAVYTSISDSHLFSIRTKEAAKICGYNGYSTDHPRIFILEAAEFKSPFNRKPSSAKNHDIFTYFNSKITLVENYVGQKLDEVYSTVMTEMCKLDKALLETKLTLARINPTEFVNSIMRRSGFSAVVAGEVLHVLECKPVYVQPFASERCYQELPVKYGNITMFLTPVTRTLQIRGTEIECTPLLPAKFKFGGRWYTFDGKIRETTAPQKLATDIVTKWTYTSLPNLMESGVYDADSLKKMRTMIYDQGDRRIATNVVHKILSGQNPSKQGFYFDALVSEKLIDNMINKYWQKLISWSSWLGNITSTAIGLYVIGRLIKFIVDTLMHGRILYDIYGFGWQLIASFWDSMTSFLTHRNTLRNMKRTSPKTYNVRTPEEGTAPSETTPLAEGEVPHPMVRAPPMYPHITLPIAP